MSPASRPPLRATKRSRSWSRAVHWSSGRPSKSWPADVHNWSAAAPVRGETGPKPNRSEAMDEPRAPTGRPVLTSPPVTCHRRLHPARPARHRSVGDPSGCSRLLRLSRRRAQDPRRSSTASARAGRWSNGGPAAAARTAARRSYRGSAAARKAGSRPLDSTRPLHDPERRRRVSAVRDSLCVRRVVVSATVLLDCPIDRSRRGVSLISAIGIEAGCRTWQHHAGARVAQVVHPRERETSSRSDRCNRWGT